jgi:hypothetical protein
VSIERDVDQWQILQEADLFVTHHGLNSTHRAIDRVLHRVQQERERMLDALEAASTWEREVIAERPAVLERILDLAL